jgi:hypothetical protein
VSQKGGDVEGLSLSARSQDLHSDKDSLDRLRSSSLMPAVLAVESSVATEPAIQKFLDRFRQIYPKLHAETEASLAIFNLIQRIITPQELKKTGKFST